MAAPLPEGVFAIIDGQHRAHAAALAGQVRIPAMVVEVDPARQAAAFAAINTDRTAVSRYHLLRAAISAGEPVALKSVAAVESAGCRLMPYLKGTAHRQPCEIFSTSLVLDHVRFGRAAVVTRALMAIKLSSIGKDVESYRDNVLSPWMSAVAARPDVDMESLVDFCGRLDLVALCNRIDRIRDEPGRQFDSNRKLALENVTRALRRAFPPGVANPPRSTDTTTHGEPVARPATMPAVAAPVPETERPELPIDTIWTPEHDALLISQGGSHAQRAKLAAKWGLPMSRVTARWHKVRVST